MDTPPDTTASHVFNPPMLQKASFSRALASASVRMLPVLQQQSVHVAAQSAELDRLIHDAQAHGHRRADHNARDRAAYRIGGAFEPVGALDIDEIQLVGLLSLGQAGVLLLVVTALEHPDADLAALLRIVFRSKLGLQLRVHGVYRRWHWLQALYVEETDTFLASREGRDPRARWRLEQPTKNQIYLAAQISRLLQIVAPRFPDRGRAHDWIKDKAGNPRFWRAPPAIDLHQFEALVR